MSMSLFVVRCSLLGVGCWFVCAVCSLVFAGCWLLFTVVGGVCCLLIVGCW